VPASVPASVTDRLPLLGAEGYEALRNGRGRLAARAGLDVARVEHLLGRYGSTVTDLLDLVEADPRLGEPITGAAGYLRAEAVYAASHEGALGLEDVLVRRTRVSIEERDRGLAAAPEVAELIAPVLGWDEEDVRREVEHYRTMVHAEMSAELQPDDRAAVAARAEVCDRAGPLAGGAPVTA
jgi:glycerol-3-phosphate dehydrogenase